MFAVLLTALGALPNLHEFLVRSILRAAVLTFNAPLAGAKETIVPWAAKQTLDRSAVATPLLTSPLIPS